MLTVCKHAVRCARQPTTSHSHLSRNHPPAGKPAGDGVSGTHGLYQARRQRGVHSRRAKQTIGADAADKDEAERLGLELGAPVPYMSRVTRDEQERAVEFGKHVYNPHHYQMTVDLDV